jgi:hypothetical protein
MSAGVRATSDPGWAGSDFGFLDFGLVALSLVAKGNLRFGDATSFGFSDHVHEAYIRLA